MPSRRAFLVSLAALGFTRSLAAQPRARLASDPFTLGLASAYPSPEGLTLWTRLAPSPAQPHGGLDPRPFLVRWQVAHDERFSRIAAEGTTEALPEWAH